MSRAAQDVLSRIKSEPAVTADPEDFYVKIIVSKALRRLLWLVGLVGFGVMLGLVFHLGRAGVSWKIMSLPIIIAGLMMALAPLSEQWAYRPWQAAPRQYEKHLRSRF